MAGGCPVDLKYVRFMYDPTVIVFVWVFFEHMLRTVWHRFITPQLQVASRPRQSDEEIRLNDELKELKLESRKYKNPSV